MSVKMKGLLKGLRYISQIFEEEEKEADIQIGFPTDVKHVAHIGWDGPSASSPSWMTEFKESPASSATSQANGDNVKKDPGEVKKSASQESSAKKGVKDSPGRDLPSLPKSSRRQPSVESVGSVESPTGSPTQKSTKSSRRRSKQKESSSPKAAELSSSIPNVPKKSRRKKSKDGEDSSRSSRSKERGSRRGSRHGSDDGSITKQYNLDSGLTN